jgi:hypothetical protein
MPNRKSLTLVVAALLASACGTDEVTQVDYTCPRVVVLADAASATVFAQGAPQTAENRVYKARIANTYAQCETTKTEIQANLTLGFKIDAGPAPAPGAQTVNYFVATTEVDARVLGKDVRAFNVVLPPGVPMVEAQVRVEGLHIPISEGNTSRNYEIVVGFQLTPEQVQYNRMNP